MAGCLCGSLPTWLLLGGWVAWLGRRLVGYIIWLAAYAVGCSWMVTYAVG